jgi:hypothetical protein
MAAQAMKRPTSVTLANRNGKPTNRRHRVTATTGTTVKMPQAERMKTGVAKYWRSRDQVANRRRGQISRRYGHQRRHGVRSSAATVTATWMCKGEGPATLGASALLSS